MIEIVDLHVSIVDESYVDKIQFTRTQFGLSCHCYHVTFHVVHPPPILRHIHLPY